jgi:hypothetical protein
VSSCTAILRHVSGVWACMDETASVSSLGLVVIVSLYAHISVFHENTAIVSKHETTLYEIPLIENWRTER